LKTLANVDQTIGILNLLPDEEFFSREADIQRLFHAGMDATRALTPSLFLCGARKSGKSEVLKRVYRRLFQGQESVVPFFHSIPKSLPSAEAFCREYFLRSVMQFLAFLRRDTGLIRAEEFDFNSAFQLAYESRYPWLVELVDNFHSGFQRKDLQTLSRLATHFALTTCLKTGLSAFVLVDDFPQIASFKTEEELALLTGDFLSVLQSRQAPHLLSGVSAQSLQSLFKTVEIPGNVVIYPLKALDVQGAKQVLVSLCERFGIALEEDLSAAIVGQLHHHPFYIRSIVEGARREELHLQTPKEFAEVYTAELTRGNLHLYFSSLLNSVSLGPQEKIRALELLHTCARLNLDYSTLHFFQREETGEDRTLGRILEALGKVNLVDHALGTVSPITDKVLADWIEWNFNHSLRGLPIPQARYQITASLLKRFQHDIQSLLQASRTAQLECLLARMDCQTVPGVLLDFSQFATLQQQKDPQLLNAYLSESEQLVFPEILTVNQQRLNLASENAFQGSLLIGRGFDEGRYTDEVETIWMVGYSPGEELVGLNEIQAFYEQCQRLARESNHKRFRMWLIAEGRFNQAALSFAQEHAIMTSNWTQLEVLWNRVFPSRQLSEKTPAKELVTFELVIPCAADAELVAVRALEQVAENLDFDEKSKGQIRMAVMEACINAKDYAVSPAAKIHLRYQAAADCLSVHVRAEVPKLKERGPTKPAAEAWNLKLLRTLMDEARISHSPQGLELFMTKYPRSAMSQTG
jgi:anti-sigma regulatory factor (Ser/Thr protein kinase)